jgi:hypothetical protein
MIVDRDIISQNFRYKTNELNHRYGFAEEQVTNLKGLHSRIDYWKYILFAHCGMDRGDKIALGLTQIGLDYIAIVFAGMELSLQFVVLDFSIQADRIGVNDYKTDAFGKIDLFLHHFPDGDENLEYYGKKARKVFHTYDLADLQINRNDEFRAVAARRPKPDDVLMLCTSSGTTGTPKSVQHTHAFMHRLAKRNAQYFSGSVMHIRNLHHGSSMAVFFLPTLASDTVDLHMGLGYNIAEEGMCKVANIANKFQIKNISFPYTNDIEIFLNECEDRNYHWKDGLNIFTLSYIPGTWKKYFNTVGINQIQSIFGCNETSGPLFVSNMLRDEEFNPKSFTKLDDFYGFTLDKKNMLGVTMPVYEQKIQMNDQFSIVNDKWIHEGREDLIKVNQVEVNLGSLMETPSKFKIDALCLTDTVYNKIYLAIWEDIPDKVADVKTKVIDKDIKRNINKELEISKHAVLAKSDFMRGIKLDHEMIRDWFRNNG